MSSKSSFTLISAGYAVGPVLWAPISEMYGRRWGMLPGVFALGLFSIGTATSTNAASIFITRLFGGICASAPVIIAPAALGDFYGPQARGIVMALVSVVITGGPTIGPIIGAALTSDSSLGWRCKSLQHDNADYRLIESHPGTEYIEAIVSFASFTISWFFLPETYAPVLASKKSKAPAQAPEMDNRGRVHAIKTAVLDALSKHFSRPLR